MQMHHALVFLAVAGIATASTAAGPGTQPTTAGRVTLRAIGADASRGSSAAVVVEDGRLVHTALLHATDADGRLVGPGDARAQGARVLANLSLALRAAGSSPGWLVRLHVYVADASVTPSIDELLAAQFDAARPAVTIVESRMALAGALVAMDAVAATAHLVPAGRPTLRRVDGLTQAGAGGAHVAIQPDGPFVIVSGRAAPGEFEPAVRGTMEQLRADLASVGLGFEHVVQVKTFLSDMTRAADAQQLVAGVFDGIGPPQVVTEWRGASLAAEIELVATAPGADGGGERLAFVEPISSRFSRVARVFGGRPVFVSGLVGASDDPARQVHEIFADLRRVLSEAGSDLRHLAKATYYVSDAGADQEINAIRPTLFDANRPPAASKISVQGTGRPGKGAAIDMIAVTTSR